jgi:hypothetical protein
LVLKVLVVRTQNFNQEILSRDIDNQVVRLIAAVEFKKDWFIVAAKLRNQMKVGFRILKNNV